MARLIGCIYAMVGSTERCSAEVLEIIHQKDIESKEGWKIFFSSQSVSLEYRVHTTYTLQQFIGREFHICEQPLKTSK